MLAKIASARSLSSRATSLLAAIVRVGPVQLSAVDEDAAHFLARHGYVRLAFPTSDEVAPTTEGIRLVVKRGLTVDRYKPSGASAG